MTKAPPSKVPLTLLYCPGDRPDRLIKATTSGSDIVVADLEDAVAPSAKILARRCVQDLFIGDGDDAGPALQVRVNPAGTPWHDDDVAMVGHLPATVGARLPKCSDPSSVARVIERLGRRPVHLLIESTLGVERAFDLAVLPGVTSIALGEADLRADLGVEGDDALGWQRARIVNAAAAAGLPAPVMSVYTNTKDLSGLEASCRRGRELGFVGRAAIHPSQLPVIREAFTPTQDQLAHAREVIAAAHAGATTGSGALSLPDGRFVDEAVVRQAHRLLARTVGQTDR